MSLKRLCIFCGSRKGAKPEYVKTAKEMGHLLAETGIELVYGGGRIGLMGVIADAVMEKGGTVIGVIPEALFDLEVVHKRITRLERVPNMHERKKRMYDLSDGFIALPGGWGTFEEIFEIVTWGQLGLHQKPCALLNVGGYFDSLAAMIQTATREGFIKPENSSLLIVEQKVEPLLKLMQHHHTTKNPGPIKEKDL